MRVHAYLLPALCLLGKGKEREGANKHDCSGARTWRARKTHTIFFEGRTPKRTASWQNSETKHHFKSRLGWRHEGWRGPWAAPCLQRVILRDCSTEGAELCGHHSLFSVHVLSPQGFIGVHSRVLSATRRLNSLNHSYVHYSQSKFMGERFTNHSNHVHIFIPITRIVPTKVPRHPPLRELPPKVPTLCRLYTRLAQLSATDNSRQSKRTPSRVHADEHIFPWPTFIDTIRGSEPFPGGGGPRGGGRAHPPGPRSASQSQKSRIPNLFKIDTLQQPPELLIKPLECLGQQSLFLEIVLLGLHVLAFWITNFCHLFFLTKVGYPLSYLVVHVKVVNFDHFWLMTSEPAERGLPTDPINADGATNGGHLTWQEWGLPWLHEWARCCQRFWMPVFAVLSRCWQFWGLVGCGRKTRMSTTVKRFLFLKRGSCVKFGSSHSRSSPLATCGGFSGICVQVWRPKQTPAAPHKLPIPSPILTIKVASAIRKFAENFRQNAEIVENYVSHKVCFFQKKQTLPFLSQSSVQFCCATCLLQVWTQPSTKFWRNLLTFLAIFPFFQNMLKPLCL